MITCEYKEKCINIMNEKKCKTCTNNTTRNYIEDYYTQANDKPFPKQRPYIEPYCGPAEQTEGYKCPICGNHTNPYQLFRGTCCRHCGYQMFGE